jgi:outer membrane protein assembly factor BamB
MDRAHRSRPTVGVRAAVDWPQFHNTPDRTGYNANESLLGTGNVGGLSLLWSFPTLGEVWSSPSVSGGVLYVGSDDNRLYALDAVTGAMLWSFRTGGDVRSSPAVVNGFVYVGSDDAHVYAVDALTGTEVWSFATGARVAKAQPTVDGGTVFIGSTDGNYYAIDAVTGSLLWQRALGVVRESGAIYGDTIFVGSDKSTLYALDVQTGRTRWEATLGGRVRCTPSVRKGTVYVGADDYRVYAYDAITGAPTWTSEVFPNLGIVRSSPGVWNGMAFVNTGETSPMGSHMYALDTTTGATVWSHELGDYATSSPAVANGVVYTGSFDHQIYAFDADTGDKLWSSGFNTMQGGVPGSVAVLNGIVYAGSLDGSVYAFTDTPGDPIGDFVSIDDLGYAPATVIGHDLGKAVQWQNGGLLAHTVTDSSGMGLFDSGTVGPGVAYVFTFVSAGIFKYACSILPTMTGKIKAPVVLEPTTGSESTPFTVTWASEPPPPGFVYDVKIRRPGADWVLWQDGVLTTSVVFLPDAGIGQYDFKAHIRDASGAGSATYSPFKSIVVS